MLQGRSCGDERGCVRLSVFCLVGLFAVVVFEKEEGAKRSRGVGGSVIYLRNATRSVVCG